MYKTILEKMIKINRTIDAINKIRFSKDITYEKASALTNEIKSLLKKYDFYRHIINIK